MVDNYVKDAHGVEIVNRTFNSFHIIFNFHVLRFMTSQIASSSPKYNFCVEINKIRMSFFHNSHTPQPPIQFLPGNIIILHAEISKSHVNINNSHVNIIT